MNAYIYHNKGVDRRELLPMIIKQLCNEDGVDKADNEDEFRQATVHLIEAYILLHSALGKSFKKIFSGDEAREYYKECYTTNFVSLCRRAGYKEISETDYRFSNGDFSYPSTVRWSKFQGTPYIIETFAKTISEADFRQEQAWSDINKKIDGAKDAGTLDATNMDDLDKFIRENV